ncbi:uncharacterized protein FOMMEDRAFT_160118 [Fomitiporia mediterranea MF3/22]|uniref:uncharacterized protein n=1 Tax=Fomitiporia mediterranea (strain MF3/22) TaxID=694068 RepID=UPI00044088EB|nr:uncharacterized protein FOMMEDRAFT_160118 [Fomitiporia mediterranea MF3/22]EJC99693.1 hypothetical protein FOMMEDRAFT_160118 [Fomitiporia mediterranea MF3/22]
MPKQWGFFRTFLVLAPLFVGFPAVSLWKHYELPVPVVDLHDNLTGKPQISERVILEHARVLSEDIGFRTVGTREHALGDSWALARATELKELCERIVRVDSTRRLECEVDRQIGSGSHRFDILSARLYKTYVNLTNIVLRISDGTEKGKEHAVLVNAHLDSTLPSPGAADDSLAVGVMLETARVLIETSHWSPSHSIIMLFNNAEESLQDGSHLFATSHPWRESVRAVLNLEAAGTHGRTLLFQATSSAMVDVYAQVPRPFGTIVANDVFSSGVIMSDTDFRQFELYMNITGLDMAVVGHSYFYHTRKDLVRYIQPGVAQHMADNTLALLGFLSSPESPLPTLTNGYTKPTTAFFSFLNMHFIRYSFATANALHFVLLAASIALIALSRPSVSMIVVRQEKRETHIQNNRVESMSEVSEAISTEQGIWPDIAKGVMLLILAFLAALISVHVVALLMVNVLDRPLSWFRVESSCLFLYGPPALAGALSVLSFLSPTLRVSERVLMQSVLLAYAFLAVVIQLAGIGSAILFFSAGCSIFAGLLLDLWCGEKSRVVLGSYALGQVVPLVFGSEMFCIVADIFVPLTGRMGGTAPAEHIIATIVVLTSSYLLPLILPFFQRFGARFVRRTLLFLTLMTGAMMVVFAFRSPFDSMHPKRVYIIHSENITTNEVSLGIGTSDSAPGFESLVQDISSFVTKNTTRAERVDMHQYNGDWDVLYPFSGFLSPYEVALDSYVSSYADGRFSVKAVNDIVNKEAGTRSLTLVVSHPGIIWTTIAFDAHVLSWSLDDSPPTEHARHFVKEASFYGEDTWSLDLVINLHDPESQQKPGALQVNFVGVKETAMWPGKAKEKEQGGPAMQVFEELDAWLEKHTGDSVDVTLLGCVGGVAIV